MTLSTNWLSLSLTRDIP